MTFLDILGWVGIAFYLLGHAYISIVKDWKKVFYYGGNLIAAVSLVITSAALESWQAVVINVFWAIVSILLLLRYDLSKVPFSMVAFKIILVGIWIVLIVMSIIKQSIQLDILGWSSAFVFCAGYLLFSANKMSINMYFICTAYAASSLMPQLWLDQNWPVFTLEVCWTVISIYGLISKYNEPRLID